MRERQNVILCGGRYYADPDGIQSKMRGKSLSYIGDGELCEILKPQSAGRRMGKMLGCNAM